MPPIVQAQVIKTEELSVEDQIKYWASYYGVDEELSLQIAKCESGLRPEVYGDQGRAYSIYQFHRPTFEEFANQLGEELDYGRYSDHIKLANWAFSKGYGPAHWTCHPLFKRSIPPPSELNLIHSDLSKLVESIKNLNLILGSASP